MAAAAMSSNLVISNTNLVLAGELRVASIVLFMILINKIIFRFLSESFLAKQDKKKYLEYLKDSR